MHDLYFDHDDGDDDEDDREDGDEDNDEDDNDDNDDYDDDDDGGDDNDNDGEDDDNEDDDDDNDNDNDGGDSWFLHIFSQQTVCSPAIFSKKKTIFSDSLKLSRINIWTLESGLHWFPGHETEKTVSKSSKQCCIFLKCDFFEKFWAVLGS